MENNIIFNFCWKNYGEIVIRLACTKKITQDAAANVYKYRANLHISIICNT